MFEITKDDLRDTAVASGVILVAMYVTKVTVGGLFGFVSGLLLGSSEEDTRELKAPKSSKRA